MMVPANVFCILFFSTLLLLVFPANGKCPSSLDCGNLGKIHFPFTDLKHPECGLLVIHGCDDPSPDAVKTIKNKATWFYVEKIDQFTIVIRDNDLQTLLLSRRCGVFSENSTFDSSSPFFSFQFLNVTLFTCNSTLNVTLPPSFSKSTLCRGDDIFYDTDTMEDEFVSSENYYRYFTACSMVRLPIRDAGLIPDPKGNPFDFVSAEFPIQIQISPACSSCYYLRRGQCQLDNQGNFFCAQDKTSKKVKILVAAASVAGALGILMVMACIFRRYYCYKENPTLQMIETFLKQHGHLSAKRYSYLDVKKMTNSFKNKLGQGGFGTVYKGRLHNGSLVAVKVLSKLQGDGEEFINEVASISMTSHINIVSLLGFCLEGTKRVLIYEYMPHGSLEKFIYEEKDPLKLNLTLNCKTMYNIAIGVARGLEYLHKGCNTKILHFDIKPHNILLDEFFCPKISDFGLAKICPREKSTVSMMVARGTAGYIAPEVFCRNFGGVSHKSDVYSYGMMVLEMLGARENINDKADFSSEKYFPHWVYSHLELNEELQLRSIKSQSDKEMVRKMTIVSLWCIQTDPSNRPAMSKVVEMMEGSISSLQIPPKPFVSSISASSSLDSQTSETS
ncbi:rust resistance kinase Lr10-like [Gastrolobium bilobum]|uniref:rust resistance kinase Lr10-like n=1 Tax=Gastrolobium bilobum TaxID=150636 RepID=UPI002AAF5ACD|nr:rust resistance kinase Lr10-like [Gastrolobium bilobum]